MKNKTYKQKLLEWVTDQIENHGLIYVNVYWNPSIGEENLSEEEKCKALYESFTAPTIPHNHDEFF
jgi:hypothetical protein